MLRNQKLSKLRRYSDVTQRIRSLPKVRKFLKMGLMGRLKGYPFYWLSNNVKHKPLAQIHLTGGIHGDEPAGVLGLLSFLETADVALFDRLKVTVFPCMNPWGYEHNRRENSAAIDINRHFHDERIGEVRLMKKFWKTVQTPYDVAISCHEDYDAPGAYLYELKARTPFWGHSVLSAFGNHVTIDPRPVIEGLPANQGWIRRNIKKYPPNLHPEAIFLFLEMAAHTMTFETPSLQPLEDRIQAQIAGLTKCFDLLTKQNGRGAQSKK